jgi:hypothetical protein
MISFAWMCYQATLNTLNQGIKSQEAYSFLSSLIPICKIQNNFDWKRFDILSLASLAKKQLSQKRNLLIELLLHKSETIFLKIYEQYEASNLKLKEQQNWNKMF